ncbi:hypothetical protein MPTK1_1g09700 [Marchantia polymorpha subsp. ruderalis]|uniref:Leucine-rich repeat-containing N-terminal plant-type domain-containing protein n=2 Tax=Marchantia polymorpha TaxID=3197 RepID=A0AAF6ANC8_MARPO|nr:hypothetical protein MARPO_0096s0031 [Marchantia polymorpha]BBM97948.1 hypothetical protein Mp_1g09700 [Marchantia polymorpha subsp. ruderalis]|eukprot:PTQ32682.1 hypothetical protein MARPO_0096s0031 [Marchantia polymorpha]
MVGMRGLAVFVIVALSWIESGHAAATCSWADSAALLSFKSGFLDKGQTFGTWKSGTDCCSWAGVTCNDAGRVKGLELMGPDPAVGALGYSTTFVPGVSRIPDLTAAALPGAPLSNLAALEVINFQNVFFNSRIPDSWMKLTSLRILQLDSCNITGSIPTTINQLKSLETLHISAGWTASVALTGSLPSQVCDLTKLLFIGLEGNSLTGPLPSCFDRLRSLRSLHLADNSITGTLPWSIGLMPSLSELNLANNQISGYIPGSIGSLPNITYLNLENNKLSGPLPGSFSLLSNLVECRLGNNQLSGRIPTDLNSWTKLQVLEFQNNQFFGEIPASLGKLTSLVSLALDNNKLWGSIPRELASIRGGRITLSNNRLSGSIPADLLNNEPYYPALHLDVSHNFLSGPLPQTIGNVWAFLASYNELSGGFPLQLASVNTVDLSNNRLDQKNKIGRKANFSTNPLYPQAHSIRELHLNSNKFKGDFPAWLLELNSLRLLDISDNKFTGPLPDAIFDFPTLWALNVSHNQFSSQLPSNPYKNVQGGQVLQMLDLHDNQCSGPISTSFLAALAKHGIMGLDLSENKFTGKLDQSIGTIGGVGAADPWTFHLDVSDNKLSGPIPETIGQLKNLKYLDLSANSFSGSVPTSISQLKQLVYLNLSDNDQLNGVGNHQKGHTELEF